MPRTPIVRFSSRDVRLRDDGDLADLVSTHGLAVLRKILGAYPVAANARKLVYRGGRDQRGRPSNGALIWLIGQLRQIYAEHCLEGAPQSLPGPVIEDDDSERCEDHELEHCFEPAPDSSPLYASDDDGPPRRGRPQLKPYEQLEKEFIRVACKSAGIKIPRGPGRVRSLFPSAPHPRHPLFRNEVIEQIARRVNLRRERSNP